MLLTCEMELLIESRRARRPRRGLPNLAVTAPTSETVVPPSIPPAEAVEVTITIAVMVTIAVIAGIVPGTLVKAVEATAATASPVRSLEATVAVPTRDRIKPIILTMMAPTPEEAEAPLAPPLATLATPVALNSL